MAKRGFNIGLFVIPFVVPLLVFVLLPALGLDLEQELGETWFTLLIIGAIVIPVFFTIFRSFGGAFKAMFGSKEQKFIQKHGIAAQGTVQALGESSQGGTITINDQPYLNLTLEIQGGGGQPYIVSFDTIIPRSAVPQFQPGAVIPVLIHPEDPQKVIIDWQGEGGGQAETPSYGRKYSAADERLLEEQGIAGRATLVDLQPTGRSEDYNPVVSVTYDIDPSDGEPYSFTKETALPTKIIQMMQARIGKTFPCKIHPNDGTKVSIHLT